MRSITYNSLGFCLKNIRLSGSEQTHLRLSGS